MEKMLVNGVQSNDKIAQISVIALKDEPGIAAKLFNALADEGINVELILQSIGRDKTKDISFVVMEDVADQTVSVLEKTFDRNDYKEIIIDKEVGIVSIKGAGMMSNPGAASMMFEALYNCGINIEMIYTSEIKITVSIRRNKVDSAIEALKEKFTGLE
ncbi:MAG: ACT domain-containing protein [Lachnospiraceae bacterium]|nr:ACT domain-containing protein [Lachnospiraceae bacterium]